MEVQLEASWKNELHKEFDKPYFQQVVGFLKKERAAGKVIFPPGRLIFNAFECTPFSKVKVVILGQDPYHGKGQAHGLSFSVPEGMKPPPSLVNIFKELQADMGIDLPKSGNLEPWALQGVLLLNASLTVEENDANSHAQAGWHIFTDEVIKHLSMHRNNIVFMLWGKFAQNKELLIDATKHKILKAAHPSPFSAHSGFLGCKHFSKANEWLKEHGEKPIDWQLM
ncbi:MAG: uracil-DNA glycosylase [Taibaiella sp.]|nr:uracil-DNA glycosylase [Taibaiella sp.]